MFVSSHQLGEVEQISDWLVMIDHGRLLYDGPIDQILDRQQAELMVATEQPSDLGTVARLAAEAGHYSTPANGHLLRIQAPASYAATLNRQAMEHDVTLVELHHEQPSLEETFLSMTTTTEAPSMTRSFLSEWIKLRRPGMILGGAGTIVGFAILTVVLTLTTASATPTDQGPGGEGLTLAQLATADGLASILASAATFIGVVALSVFAMSIASEYSQGTLRNLLVRQPRRVGLLAGKLLALASFTTIAVSSPGSRRSPPPCSSPPPRTSRPRPGSPAPAGPPWPAGSATCCWPPSGGALLGALLALVLRAPAAAVGVGLAWALPGELLVTAAWSDGARWLPGQLLDALAQGGTAAVTYGSAGLLLALYGVVAMVAGTTLFARRDVAT